MTTHWIDTFLEAIQAEQDASDNTVMAYARDLHEFETFVVKAQRNFKVVSRNDIENYLVSLETRGMAASTRARRLSSVRQLFRFAFEEGWRKDDPSSQIKGPRKTKHLPDTLSEDQVDRMLTAVLKTGRSKSDRLRNTCLMQLLYATGMRVSELVSMPIAAVRGNPEMLFIKGKGGKERMVPLSPSAKMATAAYLANLDKIQEVARGQGKPVSKFLFPSNGKLGHLTRIRFYTLVKEIAINANIDPNTVTPHTLRHAFATHLLAGGADLRVIQILLGHADLATTEVYTHVLDEKLKSLVLKHHPLAQD